MIGLNMKFVRTGMSTILTPLGKWILKKIVNKGTDKLDPESGVSKNNDLASAPQPVEGKVW